MTSNLKRSLKRFSFPVVLARVVREVPASWRRVTQSYDREKQNSVVFENRKRQIDRYFAQPGPYKLQIGTGGNPLSGWLNTDLEPTQPEIISLDALKPFPFPNQVFDYIFSEHMIEHIPYLGGLFMVKECFRVLKSGGKIRIATPDVVKITGLLAAETSDQQKRYMEWSVTHSLGLYLPEKSQLQSRRPEWDIEVDHILRQYPDVNRDAAAFVVNNFFRSYGHQFLFDDKTLSGILREAGFKKIQRFSPGESSDPNLANLESHGQLIGDENNLYETMILQAIRLAERPGGAQVSNDGANSRLED